MVWDMVFVDEGDYGIRKDALDADRKPIHYRKAFKLEYIDRTPDWPGVGGPQLGDHPDYSESRITPPLLSRDGFQNAHLLGQDHWTNNTDDLFDPGGLPRVRPR